MIRRPVALERLATAFRRSPVTALLGPRQCGKTTLARLFAAERPSFYFDLESVPDRQRLQNAELVLGELSGCLVLDEIQAMPALFQVLRVLADRPASQARFLILGSASPSLIRGVAETLAGRVEFVELSGFNLEEVSPARLDDLWLRGGFPRSFLADSEPDSVTWRENFIRTFLERDIPQLGFNLSAPTIRRFWTMLAHYHGQTLNSSEIARSMGTSDKTVRSWLDILTGAFLVRQLQPWHENMAKRQIKSPKIYLRDSGLLHGLLNIPDRHALLGHPRLGASWEGFALEQVLQILMPREAFFWGTQGGAELDLLLTHNGERYGFEFKFQEAPGTTRSMHIALSDLNLVHLWVVHPGQHAYPMDRRISAWPLCRLEELPQEMQRAG